MLAAADACYANDFGWVNKVLRTALRAGTLSRFTAASHAPVLTVTNQIRHHVATPALPCAQSSSPRHRCTDYSAVHRLCDTAMRHPDHACPSAYHPACKVVFVSARVGTVARDRNSVGTGAQSTAVFCAPMMRCWKQVDADVLPSSMQENIQHRFCTESSLTCTCATQTLRFVTG